MTTRRQVLQIAAGAVVVPAGAALARSREELGIEFTGGPMPVGGWALSTLSYTNDQHTVSSPTDQVFCAAVGQSSFLMMIGPAVLNNEPNSNALLPRGNARGIVVAGWGYLNGRWPRVQSRWAAGWSTSTCIAVLTEGTLHRFFLLDPALGQNITVELLDQHEAPTGAKKSFTVDDLKDVEQGDIYLEVVKTAGQNPAFQGDWQRVADSPAVQALVTAVKARAVAAGVRT